jgi:hypothetical protein
MKVAYIQWRDASHSAEEWEVNKIGLEDLPAVGFLVKEDEESITLTMEPTDDLSSCRLWMCIPKVNIRHMVVRDLKDAFPVKTPRVRKQK